jgi:hypothetical protein
MACASSSAESVWYRSTKHGNGQPWDNHDDIRFTAFFSAASCGQAPSPRSLKDLKIAGVAYCKTLIVLIGGGLAARAGGRDQRLRKKQQNGRDHNSHGYPCRLRRRRQGGITYGATDDFGFKAVDNPSIRTICTPRFCTYGMGTTTKLT